MHGVGGADRGGKDGGKRRRVKQERKKKQKEKTVGGRRRKQDNGAAKWDWPVREAVRPARPHAAYTAGTRPPPRGIMGPRHGPPKRYAPLHPSAGTAAAGPPPTHPTVPHPPAPHDTTRDTPLPARPLPRTWSTKRLPVRPPRTAPTKAVGKTAPPRRTTDDAIAAPDSSPARPVVRAGEGARRREGGDEGTGRERGSQRPRPTTHSGRAHGRRRPGEAAERQKRKEKKKRTPASDEARTCKQSASRAHPLYGIQREKGRYHVARPARRRPNPNPSPPPTTRKKKKRQ